MKKKQNKKLKRYRSIFINLLDTLPHLFTQKDIFNYFRKKKIKIDRTTIYRNIKKLKKQNLISEIDYSYGLTFYEKKDLKLGHHHHVVCLNCLKSFSFIDNKIEDDLLNLVEKLKSKIDIDITDHNLLLTGYCKDCNYLMNK